NELVSGRGVTIDDKGEVFRISGEDSRAIFGWYQKNPAKWQKNVMKTDIDAIVDCLDKPVSKFPPTKVATLARKKTGIYVKKLRAHNFGGIHKYADPSGTADDLVLIFESGLTLIEGTNGSGKTSILSALIWALTGQVLRTQRAPEPITELVPLHLITHMGSDPRERAIKSAG
ncbi:MAG: AAA family ATPase, partial [Betaproteobacteria bacterium]|nr:AAA family ATPase [Betaproteobacteria bacterium]